MSKGQLLASWLLMTGILAASIAVAGIAAGNSAPAFHRAAVAVIGSSQSRYALSNSGTGRTSIDPDGKPFWRYGISAISEAETVELANRALDEEADVVFIEINALLFDNDTTAAQGGCDQPARSGRISLKEAQLSITADWVRLLGRNPLPDGGHADFGAAGPFDIATARAKVPSRLRGPCNRDALLRLVRRARELDSRLILMALPRSATGERVLGPDRSEAVDRMAVQLARDLGVELFTPSASAWPDEYFVSVGHLNREGRARFTRELHGFLARRS